MTTHKQVDAEHTDRGYIGVDRGIASLLVRLWDRGIETTNSCQENHPGIVWIQFEAAEDVQKLLTTIAQSDHRFYCHRVEPEWSFCFCPDDTEEVYDEENDEVLHPTPSNIVIRPSVRFPKAHYRRLLRIFK
jgi:hypothetical protein